MRIPNALTRAVALSRSLCARASKQRGFIALAGSLSKYASGVPPIPQPAVGAMMKGSNLPASAYYVPAKNFIDLIKDSSDLRWFQAGGPQISLVDANGWPTSIPNGMEIYKIAHFMTGATSYLKPGNYKAIGPAGWTVGLQDPLNCTSIVPGNGICTFTVGSPGVDTTINYKLTNSTGVTASVPPGSIAVYHVDDETLFNAGELFNPLMLASLAGTAMIRNTDVFGNNGEYPIQDISSVPVLATWMTGTWPPELFAKLAKKLNCGMWWNQPTCMDRLNYATDPATDRITVANWPQHAGNVITMPTEGQLIMFTESTVPIGSGTDFGPYHAINISGLTYQIAHPSAPTTPINLTATTTNNGRVTRLFDEFAVWTYCMTKLYTEYPACPLVTGDMFLENWNGGYLGQPVCQIIGNYRKTGARVGGIWHSGAEYYTRKCWQITEVRWPRGIHKRMFSGFVSPAGGAACMGNLDINGIIGGTSETFASQMDHVAINPYIELYNDWSVGNPEPGRLERSEMIAANVQSWTAAQFNHSMSQFLLVMDYLLPIWQADLAAAGGSAVKFTVYEGGNHQRRDRPGAYTPGDIDEQMMNAFINYWFTSASSAMWDAFIAKLNQYECHTFMQYQMAGQWYLTTQQNQIFGLEPYYGARLSNGLGYAYDRWAALPGLQPAPLFFDDFNYAVARSDSNSTKLAAFNAAGYDGYKDESTSAGANGYLYTTTAIEGFSGTMPGTGPRCLVAEGRPVSEGAQTDYYVRYGGPALPIGTVPADFWVQFWIYLQDDAGSGKQSTFTSRSKFFYPSTIGGGTASTGEFGFLFVPGARGFEEVRATGIPGSFPTNEMFLAIDTDPGASGNDGANNTNVGEYPTNRGKLYQNLNNTKKLTENAWHCVRMHFGLGVPGQGTWEAWIGTQGDAGFTKVAEWIGGVTPGFSWQVPPSVVNGFKAVEYPTTENFSGAVGDNWKYMRDFTIATAASQLNNYGMTP